MGPASHPSSASQEADALPEAVGAQPEASQGTATIQRWARGPEAEGLHPGARPGGGRARLQQVGMVPGRTEPCPAGSAGRHGRVSALSKGTNISLSQKPSKWDSLVAGAGGQFLNCRFKPCGSLLIILLGKEMQVHYYNELWAKYFIEFDKLPPLLRKGPRSKGPPPVRANRPGGCRPRAHVRCFNSLMQSPRFDVRTR